MPRAKRNTRATRGNRGAIIARNPGEPIPTTPPDPNAGKPGLTECPICGRWVRVRSDEAATLYAHKTRGAGKVPCAGGGGWVHSGPLTIHYRHPTHRPQDPDDYAESACGRLDRATTTDRDKVTCLLCRGTSLYCYGW